jgi:hypothetical protein
MSTTTDKTPIFVFNKEAVAKKLQTIADNVNALAGKPNYNPFLWFARRVKHIADKFHAGEHTPEVQKSILDLPDAPEPLNPAYKPEVKQPSIPTGPVSPAPAVVK